MAQSGPSGTEGDIEQRPTTSTISVYTVHAGDSLSSVAQMFNVSVNTIVGANNIKKGGIHEGDVLVILPITGILHTVAKNETLASLADKYKSNVDDIAQYNGLVVGTDSLTVGQTVVIPNGEISTPVPSATTPGKAKTAIRKSGPRPTAPIHGAGGPSLGSYFAWPVGGGVITQGLHGFNAVDIGAPRGTPIYAAADGTVIVARNDSGWNGGYGNYVVIEHANGTQTLYAHATRVNVSVGDTVSQGETIGTVGVTGEVTGSHLHFEVRGAKNPFASLSLGVGE